MRYTKFLLWVVPLLAAAACSDDDGVSVFTPTPGASIRFINAVVDTGAVDLRFVDRVENLPTLQGVPFRATSGFFQRTEPGDRPTRVFPSDSALTMRTIRLVDTTVPLNANTRYTLVYAGRARAGAPAAEAHRLAVIEDAAPPTPGSGRIALQALNVGVGLGNVDVYLVSVGSATAATPADFATVNAAVLRNVNYLAKAANYAEVPALAGTNLYRFVVTAAGSTTPLFAVTPNQPGAAATASAGAAPGVRIAGSVLTAVVASGSTPGTRQSTAANRSPTVFLISDRQLNP